MEKQIIARFGAWLAAALANMAGVVTTLANMEGRDEFARQPGSSVSTEVMLDKILKLIRCVLS